LRAVWTWKIPDDGGSRRFTVGFGVEFHVDRGEGAKLETVDIGHDAGVTRLAGTSRTRVTAMLNRSTRELSTDLMLRVL